MSDRRSITIMANPYQPPGSSQPPAQSTPQEAESGEQSDTEMLVILIVSMFVFGAISFGILFLLLARCIPDNRKVLILCIRFAFFTEVLQLFFERSGRLSDVLIDSGGIYLAYRLSAYIKAEGGLSSAFWKMVQKIASVFTDEKSR